MKQSGPSPAPRDGVDEGAKHAAERRRRSTRARGALLAAALTLACAVGIGLVQPALGSALKRAKRDDLTYLPPPSQLRAMAFGYRAAGADLLWAKLVVEHGLRWEEKRAFPEISAYVDGILALDPDHPTLYEFVDSLLLFTPTGATEENTRLARKYLEQGAKQHPYDAKLWLQYGQFIAFLAPSYLKDKAEADQWRREGALAITRAVELGADADRALGATSILTKAGERKAAIAHLQRSYALSDDPETRRQIALKLQKLEAEVASEPAVETVEREWRSRYPFLSRSATLLLGPHRDPAACAGPASHTKKECPPDWPSATHPLR